MGENFKKELTEIKKAIKNFHPKADLSMVDEAFYFSRNAHKNQRRASGKLYFTHPLAVAKSLAEQGLDEVIVTAGLLHDVIEDTNTGKKELNKIFGKQVADLVDGVTKLDIISFKSRQESSIATIIKTFIAASKDLRVLIIKIFDKLHNMHTLKYLPREKQKRISSDALSIYVPLIHKLGMHEVKYELEELAFSILEPKKYKNLKEKIKNERKKKMKEVKKAEAILKRKFPETDWKFDHETKSIFTHYSKMIVKNMELSELNDYIILKIIAKDVYDCYCTMGKVHSAFKPIPYKMKDFIAIPENGIYRSLHIQVIGPANKPLKIYIITKELDDVGKKGVVSFLKNNKIKEFKEFTKIFPKIKHHTKIRNPKDLAGLMDFDFHGNTMLVFDTKGDSLALPEESTALDFSFFTNEKKALKSSGAKVNGKITPIWTQLKTGNRVKIIYSSTNQINHGWLKFVNSEKAKHHINNFLEKRRKLTKKKKGLVRLKIEAVDRPKLIMEQVNIISNNELDIEVAISKMHDDNITCYSEFFVRDNNIQNLQKTIQQLKKMPSTLNVSVDYFK